MQVRTCQMYPLNSFPNIAVVAEVTPRYDDKRVCSFQQSVELLCSVETGSQCLPVTLLSTQKVKVLYQHCHMILLTTFMAWTGWAWVSEGTVWGESMGDALIARMWPSVSRPLQGRWAPTPTPQYPAECCATLRDATSSRRGAKLTLQLSVFVPHAPYEQVELKSSFPPVITAFPYQVYCRPPTFMSV